MLSITGCVCERVLRETYLLGTSCHQPLLSPGSSLVCSKLMGDSREPNFKTLSSSLLSVFVCFKAWHFNWTPTHNGNFPFESLESCCRKMRGFSSWSSDVGRTYAATSASRCQEYGRTPELVSGAGEETNKPLICPRSHPSCNYSILEHESVLFLVAFSGAFNFYPPVSSGAWWVWPWSSNWLLPSNPSWSPQKANWPIPCPRYPDFFHTVAFMWLLYFIFQCNLTLLSLLYNPGFSYHPPKKPSPVVTYFSYPQLPVFDLHLPYNTFCAICAHALLIDGAVWEEKSSHSIRHAKYWTRSRCLGNVLVQMNAWIKLFK